MTTADGSVLEYFQSCTETMCTLDVEVNTHGGQIVELQLIQLALRD